MLQVKKLNDCIGDEVKNAVAEAKEGEVRAEGHEFIHGV
jgi:hypothetical protein